MSATNHSQGSLADLGVAIRSLRIHDVSPALSPGMPAFCFAPDLQLHSLGQHATHGAASNLLEIPEHCGSHVDAPFHFDPDGQTIDAVPVEALFLQPFKKFDLTPVDPQPGEPVDADHLHAAAERGGFVLAEGDVAILEFGWDKYLPGGQAEREPSWWGANEPGLTDAACELLAESGVSAVACDTAACDLTLVDGEVSGGAGHQRLFLPQGVLIVEGLKGLSEVEAEGLIAALPLNITGGTGSPLRVLLLTE